MEPDRSSRIAARRIVEEVLADHAARATALDGAKPVTIVERPDTPSWRAARRIVEETLAEHAARAVVPPAMPLEVVVDLEGRDIEVVVEIDGDSPTTDPPEPAVVSVHAQIERDETPAKSARRVVEGVLADHDVDLDEPTDPHGASKAFEIDPVPGARPEPPESTTTGAAAASEPSGNVDSHDRGDPEAPDEAGPTGAESGQDQPTEPEGNPASDGVDGEVVPVDDVRLRAAIPERLFAPDPEPADVDTHRDQPAALDERSVTPSVDGPPTPRTPEAVPPAPTDPDAPVAIAARIVEGVLADRERAAREAQEAQDARDAEFATLEAEIAGSEPPEQAAAAAVDTDTGPVAPEGSEARPPGLPEGWAVVPSASDPIGPGSPSGVMTVDAAVADPPAEATDAFWTGQEAVDPMTDDDFGAWPEPIAPPRRTGRWLITTVLGAVLLALLLPLAIGALRDLVSFS